MDNMVIETTIISAEDLQLDKRSLRKNAFVVIRYGDKSYSTRVDTDGGNYPHWDEKITVVLPSSTTSISFDVYCKKISGVKHVGSATVPVSDFSWLANHIHFISYRLREVDGKSNGIINMSFKIISGSNEGKISNMTNSMHVVSGYGGCAKKQQQAEDGAIAMGYPVKPCGY